MILRWINPQSRRSAALAAVMLSTAGLVLADRGTTIPGDLVVATGNTTIATPTSATATTFQTRDVAGRFAVSHGRLLASGVRPMHVEIRVRPADAIAFETRAPVAFVLVVDTSGSMAGKKMEDARQSALALLDQMRPEDMVGVVRFSTQAETIVPLGRVGDIRREARRQIERLRADGSTDIANALRTADRMLDVARRGRVGRIVLVTDGRDTSGAPAGTGISVAEVEASHGFTVSALGIGSDFDDSYLAAVSHAGRGNYEYLRDSSALSRFLTKELVETAHTRLKNVEARLRLPAGARVREVWGATWDGERLALGSLFTGDERRIVVALDVPTGEPGTSFDIGGTLTFRLADDASGRVELAPIFVSAASSAEEVDNARDMSVVASVTSVIASKRETEAAMAFEKGDRDRALALNAQNQADLDKVRRSAPAPIAAQLGAQKRAYEEHQGTFAAPPAAPAAAATEARGIGAQERKNADRAVAY